MCGQCRSIAPAYRGFAMAHCMSNCRRARLVASRVIAGLLRSLLNPLAAGQRAAFRLTVLVKSLVGLLRSACRSPIGTTGTPTVRFEGFVVARPPPARTRDHRLE
ncbi:hypothetical protein AGR6A_pa20069 [Agrobacterium sp. NCPPB 925]|nr:hypothetical protein AGR6A_pa20069 [Agrobacterium sp. NCPPB 925]